MVIIIKITIQQTISNNFSSNFAPNLVILISNDNLNPKIKVSCKGLYRKRVLFSKNNKDSIIRNRNLGQDSKKVNLFVK